MTPDLEAQVLALVRDGIAGRIAEQLVALSEHARHGHEDLAHDDAATLRDLVGAWESANAAVTAAIATGQGDQP